MHLSDWFLFSDKLEKRNEPVIIGVSAISDKSSAISSGYQASIDTSSDSVLIFKPDPFIEQVSQLFFTTVISNIIEIEVSDSK